MLMIKIIERWVKENIKKVRGALAPLTFFM
jgi:hypothetical protein